MSGHIYHRAFAVCFEIVEKNGKVNFQKLEDLDHVTKGKRSD